MISGPVCLECDNYFSLTFKRYIYSARFDTSVPTFTMGGRSFRYTFCICIFRSKQFCLYIFVPRA